jgi:ADP-heptose:LPS heptosyltransferase
MPVTPNLPCLPELAAVRRILVIKLRAMGDTLLATPTLSALRLNFPESHLTTLVTPLGASVLETNPDLNEVMVCDKSRMGGFALWRLLARLRHERFDLAIALHATWRTAWMAFCTGAKYRVVNNHSGKNYFATVPIHAKKEAKSSIERDLDAVRALGLPAATGPLVLPLTPEDHAAAMRFCSAHALDQARLFFVLAPFSGKPEKTWPQEKVIRFLDLAQRALPAARWALLAGPAEAKLEARGMGVPVFTSTIRAAGALMARSAGVITADSGPKHVAVAVGARTLTFWTIEPEAEWHPYPKDEHALVYCNRTSVHDLAPEVVLERLLQHFARAIKK